MSEFPVEQVTDRVFTPYDIQACLYDEQRVGLFQRAIDEVVKPGDVVVDGGSGTGVLGLLAARAGASRVYCLEQNSEYVDVIRENARLNGYAGQIVPICANAAVFDLHEYLGPDEQVDVIISEVISGGLFYEPQLQILANLRRFLRPGGAVIPKRMRNYVELISAQEQLYGLTFAHDTRYRQLPGDRALSDRALYLDVDFASVPSFAISRRAHLRGQHPGRVNAIRIPYALDFSEHVSADQATEFLLNPQIIFLKEALDLRAGASFTVELAYVSGDSPLNAFIKVIET